MIAIIRFKSIPGKRFEVVKTPKLLCGNGKGEYCCFYGENDCEGTRSDMCFHKHNGNYKYFRDIKEEKE